MKHRDFDSFISERKKDAPSFTMFGKVYHLPPSIPYDAVLEFRALNKRKKNDKIDDMEVLNIFKSLFGEKILNSLKENVEFDINLAVELMQWALEVYGVTTTEKEDSTLPKAQ